MEGKDRSWERRKEKRGRPPAKNSLGTFVSEIFCLNLCTEEKRCDIWTLEFLLQWFYNNLPCLPINWPAHNLSRGHHNQNTIQDKYGSFQVFLVYITAVQASAGLWTLAYFALGQDFWLEPTNPHWRIGSGQVLVKQALFILFSLNSNCFFVFWSLISL